MLDFEGMAKIRNIARYTQNKFRSAELDICYPAEWGNEGVEARLASLCADAENAVLGGTNILIVSDRKLAADRVAIPALLALSAIHQHLVDKGLRTRTGLVVETGSAREVHHFAVLAGYGAEAVHPYLALETLAAPGRRRRGRGQVRQALRQGDRQGPDEGHVQDGHLDLHVLHRRADLRGRRPQAGAARQVLHRHHQPGRGHRRVRGDGGVHPPAQGRLRHRPGAARHARRRRRVRLPHPRRGAHVDAGRDRQAAARHALGQVRHVQGVRQDHQRPEPAAT